MRFTILMAAACACVSLPAHAANFNGQTAILAAGEQIGGWTINGQGWNSVYLLSDSYSEPSVTFNSHGGTAALDITGAGNVGPEAGTSRNFDTVAGTTYQLSFWLGNATGDSTGLLGNSMYYSGSAALNLFVNGAAAGTFVNSDVTFNSVNWQRFTQSFVASGATTRVGLFNATAPAEMYAGLDDVELAAVPEPATWGMLLVGFGSIGCALRRRQRPAGEAYSVSTGCATSQAPLM